MKRPTGVTVIAIYFLVLGLLSLLWSGLVFGFGGLTSMFGSLFGASNIAASGTSSAWSGFLGILAAVVQLVVAFGLLGTRRWAWYLALVGVGLSVLQGIVGLFSGGVFAFMCAGLGLVIPVIILIYLLQGRIQQVFGIKPG